MEPCSSRPGARDLAFDRTMRLLDLGTGPGLLAFGLAPFCGAATGVDPEPAMIAAAGASRNLGAGVPAMRAEVWAALEPFAPGVLVHEVVEAWADVFGPDP